MIFCVSFVFVVGLTVTSIAVRKVYFSNSLNEGKATSETAMIYVVVTQNFPVDSFHVNRI